MESKDIALIADYWFNAKPDFLAAMGVDIEKLPSPEDFSKMLSEQIRTDIKHKKSYALIWEINGEAVGHCNVNNIRFGEQATMHLHMWNSSNRRKGIGTALVQQSLPFFFERLGIHTLICEPYALNPAPNKTVENVGFIFTKRYSCIPGALNFEQEVNRWELSKTQFMRL